MNLENISEKVRENFSQYIDVSKKSELFIRYKDEFFKDFNIESPFLSSKDILKKMTDDLIKPSRLQLENIGINIDEKSLKQLNDLFSKDKPVKKIIEEITNKPTKNKFKA